MHCIKIRQDMDIIKGQLRLATSLCMPNHTTARLALLPVIIGAIMRKFGSKLHTTVVTNIANIIRHIGITLPHARHFTQNRFSTKELLIAHQMLG